MIINDNSTPPDVLIAQLKQQGKPNKQIAALVYPELPIESAVVKVSRHLKKGAVAQYLSISKAQALNELKVNWKELLEVFTEGLEANKTVVHGKDEDSWVEVVPDHTIRMNAAKELIKHMPDESATPPSNMPDNLEGYDEVQLVRLMKNPPNQAN